MRKFHEIYVLVDGEVSESTLVALADAIASQDEVEGVLYREGMSEAVKRPNFPAPDAVQ